jgi:hypothetical protein
MSELFIPVFNGAHLEDGTLEQAEFYNPDGTPRTDCHDAACMVRMISLEKEFDRVMEYWNLPDLSMQSPTHKHLFQALGRERVKKMRKYIKNAEKWVVPFRHGILDMIKKYVKRVEREEESRNGTQPDQIVPVVGDVSMPETPKADETPKDVETPKVDEAPKVVEIVTAENVEKEKM